MSEVVTMDLDTSKLNALTEQLHDALVAQGGDASAIFRDEAMLFLRQVIRLTPPKTRQQGEAAIDRDLMKVFTPVNGDFLDDLVIEHGHNNIDEWLTTAGGEKRHVKFTYLDNTGGPMADFHNKNRDRSGRTHNLKHQNSDAWYAPYVVSYELFAAYAKKVKARVGRRKAAWAMSLMGMGGKAARWISRHVPGAKGEFHLTVGDKPSVVMINRTPGIGDDLRIVRSALRVREEAIAKRIRLVLSGYSKDVAQGIRIQRHAVRSQEAMEEAA